MIKKHHCKVIIGKIQKSTYSIYGDCYSQSKDFIEKLCKRTSAKIYDTQTESHTLGQLTVDIVLSALNALPNIKAWQTPSNSVADIYWKWDLIIEHENYFYPVQVKSSLDAIGECVERFHYTSLAKIEHDKHKMIQDVNNKFENNIRNYMINNYIKSRQHPKIVSILKEKQEKIGILESQYEDYKNACPLFIWASRDENTIKALVREFAKLFNVQVFYEDLEEKALKLYSAKQKNVIFEKEDQKNQSMSRIISSINNYLDIKTKLLAQQYEVSIQTGKAVLLEDILSVKIAENVLTIADDTLKELEKHLEKLIQNSQSYISEEAYKRKQILYYRSIRIQLGSNNKNKLKDIEDLDITKLYSKIQKLMPIDSASSKPMFKDIFILLEDIESFADEYNVKIMLKNHKIKKNLSESTKSNIIDFIE